MLSRLLTWLHQAWCSHEVALRSIIVDKHAPDGSVERVSAPCTRCGLMLRAPYGLALDATFRRERGMPWE